MKEKCLAAGPLQNKRDFISQTCIYVGDHSKLEVQEKLEERGTDTKIIKK